MILSLFREWNNSVSFRITVILMIDTKLSLLRIYWHQFILKGNRHMQSHWIFDLEGSFNKYWKSCIKNHVYVLDFLWDLFRLYTLHEPCIYMGRSEVDQRCFLLYSNSNCVFKFCAMDLRYAAKIFSQVL